MTRMWLVDDLVLRNAAEAPNEPAILDGDTVLTWAAPPRLLWLCGPRLTGLSPASTPAWRLLGPPRQMPPPR